MISISDLHQTVMLHCNCSHSRKTKEHTFYFKDFDTFEPSLKTNYDDLKKKKKITAKTSKYYGVCNDQQSSTLRYYNTCNVVRASSCRPRGGNDITTFEYDYWNIVRNPTARCGKFTYSICKWRFPPPNAPSTQLLLRFFFSFLTRLRSLRCARWRRCVREWKGNKNDSDVEDRSKQTANYNLTLTSCTVCVPSTPDLLRMPCPGGDTPGRPPSRDRGPYNGFSIKINSPVKNASRRRPSVNSCESRDLKPSWSYLKAF